MLPWRALILPLPLWSHDHHDDEPGVAETAESEPSIAIWCLLISTFADKDETKQHSEHRMGSNGHSRSLVPFFPPVEPIERDLTAQSHSDLPEGVQTLQLVG